MKLKQFFQKFGLKETSAYFKMSPFLGWTVMSALRKAQEGPSLHHHRTLGLLLCLADKLNTFLIANELIDEWNNKRSNG